MDDFVLSNLHESRSEWCARLMGILTPFVVEGIKSIFDESWKMCVANHELSKYLMTFQNLLARVPKWNSVIVEEERKRIVEKSGCNYLEDLITCVHIIQLKVLTCIRVGNKQKKIDIAIPKLDHFIHRVYIHVARKVYCNSYLFEKNITNLQVQKNLRELELMVQECIFFAIRESIPTEAMIRAYLEEAVEEEEEIVIEPIENPIEKPEKSERPERPEKLIEKPDLPSELSVESIGPEITKTEISPMVTFNALDQYSDHTDKYVSKEIEDLEIKENERREKDIELSGALRILNDDIPLNDKDFTVLSEKNDLDIMDL